MDKFSSWNLVLLQSFFSPASAGESVQLAVDRDTLDALAPELDGDRGFLSAVRAGPSWPTVRQGVLVGSGGPADLLERALGMMRQRRRSGLRPRGYLDPGMLSPAYRECNAPTYLPILAALVRNSANQRDSSYYPALQADLQLPAGWGSPQMNQLGALWEDLEDWTKETGGRFGHFRYQQIGGLVNVGVPRSQIIVTRHDARVLTRVFAQAGIRPGQAVTDTLLLEVMATARGVNFLSAALTEALHKPEFEQILRERLMVLLEDWDGSVYSAGGGTSTSQRSEAGLDDTIQLALGLAPGNTMPWEVRWRVPALRDAGLAQVEWGPVSWEVQFSGTESATTRRAEEGAREAARSLLSASADESQDCAIVLKSSEEHSGYSLGELRLPRSILRTLIPAWEDDGASGQVLLYERPLPAYGSAYLLAAQSNVSRLESFLARNAIAHTVCPTEGLPQGWMLVHIAECALLTDDLRAELPDGERERVGHTVVRLVGGRLVQRGSGRQYLAFDLPVVELDAPSDARLEAPGLTLVERTVGHHQMPLDGEIRSLSSLRRFDVHVDASGAAVFDIRAMLGAEVIGKVRLRLAAESGLLVSSSDRGFLDPRGYPATGTVGLRGAMVSSEPTEVVQPRAHSGFDVHLGWPVHRHAAHELQSTVASRFLDALAQAGTIGFGQARDQIRRLAGPNGPVPNDVLRELRARGYIEIETNARGYWARIHAVPPFMSVLPVSSSRGREVAVLGGTLRLQHWRAFSEVDQENSIVLRDPDDASQVLPAIRVASQTVHELGALAENLGCEFVEDAPRRIAAWASSLSEIEGDLMANGVEGLGAGARQVWRFVAPRGHFASSNVTSVSPHLRCELFKVEDIETGSHWIYVLGFRNSHAQPRYTFVRDVRWGTWVALAASAAWARERFNLSDLDPWPIHYDHVTRTLWLPARLNLPVVLERALLLCSGTRPIEERVCRAPADNGVGVSRYADGRGLGVASLAYNDYVPAHPAWARWLGYRWVPPEIAGVIARKLGAAIQPFARLPT